MISLQRSWKMSMPLALTWSHNGLLHRVTPWPEVQFEFVSAGSWLSTTPTDEMFASAAKSLGEADWRAYLEFVPLEIREYIERFSSKRLQALQVAHRCPALFTALDETPALTAFLSAHRTLRGTDSAGWDEINAVNERSGIFGVLAWLGLPATRQTLSILHHIADPELPKRFLEPLRTQLWEPRTSYALHQMADITDRELAMTCHALAA